MGYSAPASICDGAGFVSSEQRSPDRLHSQSVVLMCCVLQALLDCSVPQSENVGRIRVTQRVGVSFLAFNKVSLGLVFPVIAVEVCLVD